MRDVAALAGVSLKTVSRVINAEPAVSTDVRGRVLRAIAQLDYRPNLAASNLRRSGGKTATLGLVLQQGTGSKNQPFRYALPGKEEEWMKDPMYELSKKYEESDRLVRESLGKPWLLRGEGR